jgi:hypothetical protein
MLGRKPELVVNFEIVRQAGAADNGLGGIDEELEASKLLPAVAAVSESDSGLEASC